MSAFKVKIIENSGKIIKDLDKLSELNLQSSERIYAIAKDGQDVKRLRKYLKQQVQLVSTRYIDYCI